MGHVAVVLAAGLGTRMRSDLPKVLHPVAGRPMLSWVLDAVAATGPERTVVVVGADAAAVVAALPPGVEHCVQDPPRGTGHAVEVALAHLAPAPDDAVLVVPGDTPLLTADTLADLVAAHGATSADVTLLTTVPPDPTGYGRIVRSEGRVVAIVEHSDADAAVRAVGEVNSGVYAFAAGTLGAALATLDAANAQGEIYLTDVVAGTVAAGRRVETVPVGPEDVAGVNTHVQLAEVATVARRRLAERWMLAGVRMVDPAAVHLDADVVLAPGVVLYPGVHLEGGTAVEAGAVVGPDVYAADSRIGAGSRVWYAVLRQADVGEECEVGPYASLRPGTVLRERAKAGTFVEMKKTVVGEGAKVPHLSYMGDATIGPRANIGAGTITCNFDGYAKHETHIGADAFVGSDTMLVAPVVVGDGAVTGAGSAITDDVEPGALGVARARQRNVPGFAARLAARYRSQESSEEA